MQSTKPPYTSIRSVPAGAILGNSSGATAAAQALDASTVRTVIGLGTAATAAAGDFEPAGSIAALSSVYQPLDSDLTAIAALTTTTFGRALLALADAAAGRTAFGLGTAATAAIAATGTADRVQKRSGTGNTLVDSLFGVTDTTGIASLMGTTACYRAYDSAGTKYVEAKHDGTNGKVTSSSGNIRLSPASGTVEFEYFGTINQTFGGGGVTVFDVGGAIGFRNYNNALATVGWACKSNDFQFGQTMILKWNNANAYHSGSTDTGIARNAAGVLEINNGTAGAYRDLYLQSLVASQNITVGSGYWLKLANASTALTASADGAMLLSTFGSSTTLRIQYGGTSSAFPMTKRNGTDLEVRLADDSALTTLAAIVRPAAYTFATVPTASSNTGSTIRITDRSNRQAYSDGTNWRFVADDAIIS